MLRLDVSQYQNFENLEEIFQVSKLKFWKKETFEVEKYSKVEIFKTSENILKFHFEKLFQKLD